MNHNFENPQDEKKLVKNFEGKIDDHSSPFFEIHAYETIIDYYLDRAEYDKALCAINHAMNFYPFSSELLLAKAQILSNMEQYDNAWKILEKLTKVQSNNAEIQTTMGGIMLSQERYHEALSLYQGALSLASEDINEIYYQIGLTHQCLTAYDQAIIAYQKCIDQDGFHEYAIHNMAYCLNKTEQLQEKIIVYQEFAEKNPYAKGAWYNLGVLYNTAEDYQNAVTAYEYAVTIDNAFTSAYYCLGITYSSLNQHNKALYALQKTIDLEGASPEVCCHMGLVYKHIEQHDLALKYFRQSIQLDPLYEEAWVGGGSCLIKQGKWRQALYFYNQLLTIEDDHYQGWQAIARIEHKLGNIASSIKAYKKAIYCYAHDEAVWLDWSALHYERNEYEKAIAVLDKGLEKMSGNKKFISKIAIYLLQTNNLDTTQQYLKKILIIKTDQYHSIVDAIAKIKEAKNC